MIVRGYKRIPVALDAELVSSNVKYPAFIENISEDGIYAKIAYTETSKNLSLETSIHLIFRVHSGEMLNLMCRKKWTERNTSNSLVERIGVEIIDPPEEYREFISIVSSQ